MAGKLSEHWQDGKTLQECNLHLMENEYSDITFRLHYKDENKREEVADIPALRLLCLARSPVFYAMFNGELAQHPDNKVFDIHDELADPEAFKQMIRFMYSDDVTLTADNVLAILYLSQKYIVSTLTKRCMEFLEERLTPDTAALLLEQSILYEEKELKSKTLNTIEEEAEAVLAADEFVDVSKETLGEMLKLNLKVSKEITVFEACMKWAQNQCQKLKKSPSGENIREVLGNNLYLIRFPTMSLSELADVVAPQNVLTDAEGFQVFRFIKSESQKPENLPFQTEHRFKIDLDPRSLVIPTPYSKLDGMLSSQQEVSNKTTSLSCTTSKPVCLRRIYVHMSNKYLNIKHELTVALNQNGKCLHEYTGQPSPSTGQLPPHHAVDVPDVRVESGAMELDIKLTLSRARNPYVFGAPIDYSINLSSANVGQLSDDYVRITFPPTKENLLLGLEYRIP